MHDIFATFLMLKYHCCMILTFNINKIIIHIFKWHRLLFLIIFFHLIINFHIPIAIAIHIHSHIIIIIISIIFRFNLLIRSSYIILTIIYIMITISYTTMITIITFCMLFIIFIFF